MLSVGSRADRAVVNVARLTCGLVAVGTLGVEEAGIGVGLAAVGAAVTGGMGVVGVCW